MKAVRGMRVKSGRAICQVSIAAFEWSALADDFKAFAQGQGPERPLLFFPGCALFSPVAPHLNA
jgi:hypothetical protein